jgi:hypothetical protein
VSVIKGREDAQRTQVLTRWRRREPIRPDMALAFDRLDAAARHDGVALTIVSAFSGQRRTGTAVRRPPRRQVGRPARQLPAPPGNELDLGPPIGLRLAGHQRPPLRLHQTLQLRALPLRLRASSQPPGLRLGRTRCAAPIALRTLATPVEAREAAVLHTTGRRTVGLCGSARVCVATSCRERC